MTADQVRALVLEVLGGWVGGWKLLLIVAGITIIAAAIGAYAGAYFGEAGKNAALKRDIQGLTKTTEAIKTELSGGLWLDQRRWDLKRELYVALLEGLDSLDYALLVMIGSFNDAEQAEAANDQNARQRFDKLYGAARERAIPALISVRRARTIGRVFLSRDAQAALTTMAASWTSGLRSSSKGLIGAKTDLAETLSRATEAIVQAAKADLFAFRPPS